MHQRFINEAIKEANKAYFDHEVPIGCVIVNDKKIISKGYNQTEKLRDSTAHAEMIAITSAMEFLQCKYLFDCTLYVTLKPCIMCLGAIYNAKIKNTYYILENTKDIYDLDIVKSYNIDLIKLDYKLHRNNNLKLLSKFFANKR